MPVGTTAGQMIEMEAVLGLAPVHPIAREALEDTTMEVERVLDEYVVPITDGASASANFENGCIEVDLVLTGATMSELYQKVALVVTQLDRYCGINIAPLEQGAMQLPPIAVQGSQMRRVERESGPLVPA
jgi:hypothetical protein